MASLIPMPSNAVSDGQRGPSSNPDGSPPQIRHPMPPHWKSSFEGSRTYATSLEFSFKWLCLMSFGSRNLDELWSTMGETGEDLDRFISYKDRLISKVSIVTVVVSWSSTLTSDLPNVDLCLLRPAYFLVRPQHWRRHLRRTLNWQTMGTKLHILSS